MKSARIPAAFFSVLLLLTVSWAAHAADIGSTVKQSCTRCHSAKRICLNVGVKSADGWKSTINRMLGKGAQLSASQASQAVNYLSGLKPGSGPLCN